MNCWVNGAVASHASTEDCNNVMLLCLVHVARIKSGSIRTMVVIQNIATKSRKLNAGVLPQVGITKATT